MIFFLTVAKLFCEKISSDLFITISYKFDVLEDIHKHLNSHSLKIVSQKYHSIGLIFANKMELPGGKGANKKELYNNLIKFSFDENLKNDLNLAVMIYGDITIAAKMALHNLLKDLINDNSINDIQFLNRYQTYFYHVFDEVLKLKGTLDHKNIEFNSFIAYFAHQKIIIDQKSIDLNNKIEKDNFVNLVKQNQRLFCVRHIAFFNLKNSINIFKEILNRTPDPKIRKIFTLNLNTDMILFDYIKENKNFNIESFKTYINGFINQLQQNMSLINEKTLEDFEQLKKHYNVIFRVNNYRSDFLGLYYEVLIADMVEKTWFIRAEITDVLFEFTGVIDKYLNRLFGSDANKLLVIHTKDK